MSHPVVSRPLQADFLAIPECPLVYWLKPKFFELLQSPHRLQDVAEVRRGLGTSDDEQFVRCYWEVTRSHCAGRSNLDRTRWFRFAKGGGYRKWIGLESLVVDWENDGESVKRFALTTPGTTHWSRNVRSSQYYFRPGLTYSRMARGSLAARILDDAIFSTVSYGIFSSAAVPREALAVLLSSRMTSYLLRVLTQDLNFESGYLDVLPMPETPLDALSPIGMHCVALKSALTTDDPIESRFVLTCIEQQRKGSLLSGAVNGLDSRLTVQSALHSLEGMGEDMVCNLYGLRRSDRDAVLSETGIPAGWYPLIARYDALPGLPEAVDPLGMLRRYLSELPRLYASVDELTTIKCRLRTLYQDGPGSAADNDTGDDDGEKTMLLGGRIPIPAESFLEELSQKLEIHPISVYWLLKEMREQEGLVCPPELKRHMEDYVSVSILRMLGYRWPEQDRYEAEHGPILAPELVDGDGIIPLVPCGGEPTAEERVRMRLERDFGEEGAEQSLREFRQWVGRDLGDWLRQEFFKRHVQQFKQRPIAWHLVSPGRTFEAFVLYHRLSRETLQKLRAQYAGSLIERLRADQERARARGESNRVTEIQLQIEDVEEFRSRIEKIERGDELKYRIRCRWKGEEETGRPGPYAPDIDDGVKVNIRPFQETGLLVVKQVIKRW